MSMTRRWFLAALPLAPFGQSMPGVTWTRRLEDEGRRLIVTVSAGSLRNEYAVWAAGDPLSAPELARADRMARTALTAWLNHQKERHTL